MVNKTHVQHVQQVPIMYTYTTDITKLWPMCTKSTQFKLQIPNDMNNLHVHACMHACTHTCIHIHTKN